MKPLRQRSFAMILTVCFAWIILFSGTQTPSFQKAISQFRSGYLQLGIPDFEYDFHTYFSAIPSIEQLNRQQLFFQEQQQVIHAFNREQLGVNDKADFDHLQYEITFNLQRIALEKQWVLAGRKIPVKSLYELDDRKSWYAFFIKRYTTLDLTPEQIYQLGTTEVQKVQEEIRLIRLQSEYKDSAAFYRHLQDESFIITDKPQLIRGFETIDSTTRKHLDAFIGKEQIPAVYPMEWPDAGPNTPPGMYMNHAYNPYGKDVFQFNFYRHRFNKRAMEWIYMHEAIPGHHLQASFRDRNRKSALQELFLYPGNFEGWGCYVEYSGKELGLFKDPYSYLGKWEWDLVRSARLVLDAGIHYYGWTYEQALAYWKATIPGQDDIAEREVTRVSNWAGQTLSYKAGADFIFTIKKKWMLQNPGKNEQHFHRAFLEAGMLPLPVIEKKILPALN